MALTFTASTTTRAAAVRTSSNRRPAVKVVAQAQSLRAAEVSASAAQQSRASVQASASLHLAQPAQEAPFFAQLANFFNAAPQQQQQEEEEEWRLHFGHLLDEHEEQGARHAMYGSHLAERMALEPRMRS